jgi:hypothetical protein
MAEGLEQLGGLFHDMGVEPLLELVENDDSLGGAELAGLLSQPAKGVDEGEFAGEGGNLVVEFAEEIDLGAVGGGFEGEDVDLGGELREDARAEQRTFAGARRAQYEANTKGVAGGGEVVLPEGATLGEAGPVSLAGEQFEEHLGICLGEGPETAGGHQELDGVGLDRFRAEGRLAPPFFEVDEEFAGIVVAVGGTFLEEPKTDPFEFGRQVGPEFAGWAGRFKAEGLNELGDFAMKRASSGEHLVGNDSQREEVAATIEPQACGNQLLGTAVGDGASGPSGEGVILADGEPKVSQAGGARGVLDEDIRRLDVAVDQIFAMEVQ